MVWMKRVVLPSRVAGDFQQQGSSEAMGLDKGQERTKPRVEKPEGMRKGLLLCKLRGILSTLVGSWMAEVLT